MAYYRTKRQSFVLNNAHMGWALPQDVEIRSLKTQRALPRISHEGPLFQALFNERGTAFPLMIGFLKDSLAVHYDVAPNHIDFIAVYHGERNRHSLTINLRTRAGIMGDSFLYRGRDDGVLHFVVRFSNTNSQDVLIPTEIKTLSMKPNAHGLIIDAYQMIGPSVRASLTSSEDWRSFGLEVQPEFDVFTLMVAARSSSPRSCDFFTGLYRIPNHKGDLHTVVTDAITTLGEARLNLETL